MAIKEGRFKKRSILSFTLVETLVVIAIISVVLPAMFGMIYGVIKAQIRIYQLKIVKREGDYFLTVAENKLRNNAISVYNGPPNSTGQEVCLAGGPVYLAQPSIYFTDQDNNSFGFYLDNNRIEMEDDAGVKSYLTSEAVVVKNLQFSCIRKSTYSGPLVYLSFTVGYNKATKFSGGAVTINYQTEVLIRRY